MAVKPDIPDPVLLGDGTVIVFTESDDAPDGYESQRVSPDDDDYAYWVGQAQATTQASPRKPRGSRVATILVGLAIMVTILLWAAGTFDRLLYPVGLNLHECARNGFGATFCGKELDEYRERISRAKQEGRRAGEEVEQRTKQAGREVEESARRGY